MENLDWLISQIDELQTQETTFANKALLEAAKDVAKEQAKRLEQAEMELDGRIWSPTNW
ncbi:hypothetical protein ACQW5G_05255 [Fructilactobacillus sp. Tb1]|uniref:hypothetical protein n=1 Tax=Fructilactobacillus sp. Tb1 TaxID=3422304 RepID=UPI003D2BF2FB